MYKTIILLTILVLLIGCSQKQVKKKVKAEIKVVDYNKMTKKDVIPKKVIPEEFIPKHIRLSHIEVVPH